MDPSGAIQTAQPRHIPDDIADQLREAIFSRQYLPGDRLAPERDLAEKFRVHRASVREALQRLEAEGLLRIRHGDGVFVRDFLTEANVSVLEAYLFSKAGQSAETLRNIQEFRVLLQREMSALAAKRATKEDLASLEGVLSLERTEKNPVAFRALDWSFFQTVARASHNIAYTFLLNSVRAVHERWGSLYFSIPGTIETTHRFHSLIARAIRKGDAARAASVTVRLLNYSNPLLMEGLMKFMGRNP